MFFFFNLASTEGRLNLRHSGGGGGGAKMAADLARALCGPPFPDIYICCRRLSKVVSEGF
jgi:hypothetical protein